MTDIEEFRKNYNRTDCSSLTGDQLPYAIKSVSKREDGNFDVTIQAPLDPSSEIRVWDTTQTAWVSSNKWGDLPEL